MWVLMLYCGIVLGESMGCLEDLKEIFLLGGLFVQAHLVHSCWKPSDCITSTITIYDEQADIGNGAWRLAFT